MGTRKREVEKSEGAKWRTATSFCQYPPDPQVYQMSNFATPLEAIQGIILAPTEPFDLSSTTPVRGYDFGNGVDYDAIFAAMKTVGFQATNFGLAVDELNAMVRMP